MMVGQGNVMRFVEEWLAGDVYLTRNAFRYALAGSSDLYTAYIKWCRETGVRNPREANQFGGEIAKRSGWWKGLKARFDDLHCVGQKTPRWRLRRCRAREVQAAAAALPESERISACRTPKTRRNGQLLFARVQGLFGLCSAYPEQPKALCRLAVRAFRANWLNAMDRARSGAGLRAPSNNRARVYVDV